MRSIQVLDGDLPGRWTLRADGLWVGEQVLDNDDANEQERLDSYAVFNARVSWALALRGDADLVFFAEGRNLFDESYNNNIRINAFGSRFYEPAPGSHVYVGLVVNYATGGSR